MSDSEPRIASAAPNDLADGYPWAHLIMAGWDRGGWASDYSPRRRALFSWCLASSKLEPLRGRRGKLLRPFPSARSGRVAGYRLPPQRRQSQRTTGSLQLLDRAFRCEPLGSQAVAARYTSKDVDADRAGKSDFAEPQSFRPPFGVWDGKDLSANERYIAFESTVRYTHKDRNGTSDVFSSTAARSGSDS
jgi:hypothetical protein